MDLGIPVVKDQNLQHGESKLPYCWVALDAPRSNFLHCLEPLDPVAHC